MNKSNLWVGIFVTVAVLLFGAGLFLIGNQHKAFRKHTDFYTDLANVDGISKGAKVAGERHGCRTGAGADYSVVSRAQVPAEDDVG